MNLLMMARTTLFVLFLAAVTVADDKLPNGYQRGTITGYNIRIDSNTSGGGSLPTTTDKRRAKVYELKGPDLVYQVDYCGAFQAGKFDPGQTVDYRVDGERLYIRHDGGKEYNCKIEGKKAAEGTKPDASSTH